MQPAPSPVNPWFPLRKPNPLTRLRLFCFPFAGGGAVAYNTWAQALPPGVELCAVQLPGRERRLLEPPFREIPPLLDALEPVMAPLLDLPFVFFGYSMGSRIALAYVQRLQAQGRPLPRGLVVAAASAPHIQYREPYSKLSDERFIDVLRRYEGTPAEVFNHRELVEMLLPMLRADFSIADSLLPAQPVSCPLSAWGADSDPHVIGDGLERWSELTTGEFRLRRFPGNHFFLRTARDELLAALREELLRWAPELGK
jgi:surfactin synthase thioesterase subunit